MNLNAGNPIEWSHLPSLPENSGCAGNFAGVSNDALFCMGGTGFPDKLPGNGGHKTWYEDIYMLQKGKTWVKIKEKLPCPLAYGVSISYKENIILIGGNNGDQYSNKTFGYRWNGEFLQSLTYPDLRVSLANMAGALVNNLAIIVGGNSSPKGLAIKKCYALDFENLEMGWFEFEPWPGPERLFPVCASFKGQFYLFSGETVGISAGNVRFRHILQDAYRLIPMQSNGIWTGSWQKLAPMPRGMSAGGSPVPVLNEDHFFFWGGVDALTALEEDPIMHPGISKDILFYYPDTDTWQYAGKEETVKARVTVPVVYWNNQWGFISGEIKPGVRINTIIAVK